MSNRTPNDAKTASAPRGWCGVVLVLVLTFTCMLAYELVKEFTAPQLTKWQSHWLTICVTSFVAALGASHALRQQRQMDRRQFLLRLHERQQAESALRRIHEENQNILTSIESLLIGLDGSSRITMWNRVAEDLLGISASAAVGKPFASLALSWDVEYLNRGVRDCLSGKGLVKLDHCVFPRLDGNFGSLGISMTPLTGRYGSAHGVLILGTDITDRRNLEIQLAQAQKLESIGQLAAGIAHEINTPIQYVGDNVSFLGDAFVDIHEVLDKHRQALRQAKLGTLDEAALAELERTVAGVDLDYLTLEVPKAIAQAREGVNHVAKIVRAMKEFSHPGSENKVAENINKLIENAITVAGNEWKHIANVVTDLDPSMPQVPCLAGEFNQVILNLIVNAAHAIGDRGQGAAEYTGLITVTTRTQGQWAEIRVQDTGAGIPEAIRSRIFDPFFTTKAVGRGTGQGLAIAHAVIVKKHSGTLTFETEIGKGTTFVIRLPITDAARADAPLAVPQGETASGAWPPPRGAPP